MTKIDIYMFLYTVLTLVQFLVSSVCATAKLYTHKGINKINYKLKIFILKF